MPDIPGMAQNGIATRAKQEHYLLMSPWSTLALIYWCFGTKLFSAQRWSSPAVLFGGGGGGVYGDW